MRNLILNPPLLGFVVGTRAALGVGIGLLLASRLSDARRRAIARSLIAVGAASTIPAARLVLSRRAPATRRERFASWARGAMER